MLIAVPGYKINPNIPKERQRPLVHLIAIVDKQPDKKAVMVTREEYLFNQEAEVIARCSAINNANLSSLNDLKAFDVKMALQNTPEQTDNYPPHSIIQGDFMITALITPKPVPSQDNNYVLGIREQGKIIAYETFRIKEDAEKRKKIIDDAYFESLDELKRYDELEQQGYKESDIKQKFSPSDFLFKGKKIFNALLSPDSTKSVNPVSEYGKVYQNWKNTYMQSYVGDLEKMKTDMDYARQQFNEMFTHTGLFEIFEKEHPLYEKHKDSEGWANAMFHYNNSSAKDEKAYIEWVKKIEDSGAFEILAVLKSLDRDSLKTLAEDVMNYYSQSIEKISLNEIFENIIAKASALRGDKSWIMDLPQKDSVVGLAVSIFKESGILNENLLSKPKKMELEPIK